MRQKEDRELRDFEIRQWYYILRAQYIREGMSATVASEQAYDDIGLRFCLRKTSLRRAKNACIRKDKAKLMFEVKNNLQHLKQTILRLEKAMNDHKRTTGRK